MTQRKLSKRQQQHEETSCVVCRTFLFLLRVIHPSNINIPLICFDSEEQGTKNSIRQMPSEKKELSVPGNPVKTDGDGEKETKK